MHAGQYACLHKPSKRRFIASICLQAKALHVAAMLRSQPASAKRPFAAVTGHSLPKSSSQPKASKDHPAARPGAATKTSSSMLVPPQLRGRCVVGHSTGSSRALRFARARGTADSSWLHVVGRLAIEPACDERSFRQRATYDNIQSAMLTQWMCCTGTVLYQHAQVTFMFVWLSACYLSTQNLPANDMCCNQNRSLTEYLVLCPCVLQE